MAEHRADTLIILNQGQTAWRHEIPPHIRIGQLICQAVRHGRPTADDGDLFTTLQHVGDDALLDWIKECSTTQ